MHSSITTGVADCVRRGAASLAGVTGPSPSGEGLPAIDYAVGVELVSLVVADAALADAHADDWISVQLLATASVLLPRVATSFVLSTVDVSASLLEAALALRLAWAPQLRWGAE